MSRPILCALEYSQNGRQALEAATTLAIDLDTPLVLVHAFAAARYAPVLLGEYAGAVSIAEHAEMAENEAIQLTQEWAEWARGEGAEVITVADEGPPVDLVVATAKAHDARMIVVGTHGRGSLGKWLFGSVSEAISHKADRPVLVVG